MFISLDIKLKCIWKDFRDSNMAGGDIQEWFKSLPIFTRYWFGLTVAFTLLGRFSLLNPHWLMLTWDTFITK